jgi:hypothetical protein
MRELLPGAAIITAESNAQRASRPTSFDELGGCAIRRAAGETALASIHRLSASLTCPRRCPKRHSASEPRRCADQPAEPP